MTSVRFTRTEQAATKERLSTWDLIEAIGEDAVKAKLKITSAESCVAAKAALSVAGCEYADGTVIGMCLVAKFDHESTEGQRQLWRTYGTSSIETVARAGWSQEAAANLLSGEHRTRKEIRAMVASSNGAGPIRTVRSFDERCATWVTALDRVMVEGAALKDEADTTEGLVLGAHSEMALAIYARIIERQLDAELRDLLGAA